MIRRTRDKARKVNKLSPIEGQLLKVLKKVNPPDHIPCGTSATGPDLAERSLPDLAEILHEDVGEQDYMSRST